MEKIRRIGGHSCPYGRRRGVHKEGACDAEKSVQASIVLAPDHRQSENGKIDLVRTFCFIFIVYVVFLLTQPCQDLTALGVNGCESDTYSAHVERSPEQPCDDECLPFCICSCCSHPVASVVFTLGITTEASVAAIYADLIEYRDPDTQTYRNSIWQPPKA